MHKFTDSMGDEWRITITIGDIKRIEGECGVNLLKLDKPYAADAEDWQDDGGKPLVLLTRLELDLELLFDVIFAVCQPQAMERGINGMEFGQRMGGASHMAAIDAFWKELIDFFQSARRIHLVKAIHQQRALMARAIELAGKQMDNQREQLEKQLSTTFGNSSGPMQESSASIPDRLHTGNSSGLRKQKLSTTGGTPGST